MATLLSRTPVSGTIETPMGEKPQLGRVRFLLPRVDSEGVTIVAPVTQEFMLDSEGVFSASLWSSTEGERGLSYTVQLVRWDAITNTEVTDHLGYLTLAASIVTQNLADLLTDAAPAPTPTDLLAQINAAVAAAQAAATAAAASAASIGAFFMSPALLFANAASSLGAVGAKVVAGLFQYTIADPAATDHDKATAGGVKLYLEAGNDGGHNVRGLGATGDSVTDDIGVINAAIVSVTRRGGMVVIPPANQRYTPSVVPGYYRCNSPMILVPGCNVKGAGSVRTELRFPNDTNCVEFSNAASLLLTSKAMLEGFKLRGNADVSTVATQTIGLNLLYPNICTFRDLFIQDFVHGVLVDAGSVGAANTTFDFVEVSNTKRGNPINGFPKTGMRVIGGAMKPQGIVVTSNCRFYAEEAVVATDFNGTGAQVNFDVDLTSKGGLTFPTGLQVYLKAANGLHTQQVLGTDFNLFDITSGSPVAIAPTATYVFANLVRVQFTVAPPVGTNNVRTYWSDPNGEYGILVEKGTGNEFAGSIGGWKTLVEFRDTNNIGEFKYGQVAGVGFRATAAAHNCQIFATETSAGSIVHAVDIAAGVKNLLLMRGQPGPIYKTVGGTQSGSGTTPVALTLTGADYLEVEMDNPGCLVVVNADLDVTFSNTGTNARVNVSLEESQDLGGTWTQVNLKRLEIQSTAGASHRTDVKLRWRYEGESNPIRGILKNLRYRIVIAGVTSSDSYTVNAGGNNEGYLIGQVVNRN
ncbi:MAG: hypothetical protein ACRCSU_04920 [Paracoccaceae bacterium]